jgi:hypothetical protein
MTRAIVTKEMLREAAREVRRLGPHPAKVKLSKAEPDLVEHVLRGLDRISKKLVAAGLPHEQGVYPDMLQVVLSSLEAQRKAQSAVVERLREPPGARADTACDAAQVTADLLDQVEAAYWPLGRHRAMRELHAVEPELQRFVIRVHASVQEQMAEFTMPEGVRELVSEQIMIMGVVCAIAARKTVSL